MSPEDGISQVERRIKIGGDLALRVLDESDGPPVLLLHGYPDRAEMWRYVAARLRAAGRRTIAPDLRGFGESSAPPRRGDYHIDLVVDDLIAILDGLGLDEPVDVIGHDWGAFAGWALCLAHPDRISRYVALATGHPAAYLRAGLDQLRKSAYIFIWQIPGLTERALSENGFRRFRLGTAGRHPDLEHAVADLSRPGRLTAGLNWYRANYLPAAFRRWENCRVPTLGVSGSEDKYLGEAQMIGSAKYVDAPWRYARLEGVGHWLPLEAPDAVADLAIEWLDGAGES